jgi:hypothetical protein
MKKIFVCLLIVVFLISGCSFNVDVITPIPEQADATPSATMIASPLPTISVTVEAPPVGFTPVSSDPVFYNASVSLEQSGAPARIGFPTGTKQVFATWHYRNMRAGLTIKREWYLNGEPWLLREEPWDFEKYGAAGVMSDISIYDLDAGLPEGLYQLKVYINNVLQPIGVNTPGGPETFMIFEILREELTTDVPAPNSQWSAGVSFGNRLVIRDVTGSPTEIFAGREISYVAWLPDSQHVLFVDRDRSGQVANLLVGVRDELWIADVLSREVISLYQSDTTLGSTGGLYPSPNGKYVAGISGSGFGDACFMDSQVIFFEMAGDYKSVKVIKQKQFSGVPRGADKVIYPVAVGTWESNTQYRVPLNGTCDTDPSLMGLYLFDIPSLKANQDTSGATPFKVGDLGWGEVHGVVTDAVTGKAIAGALVTCEHRSYTSIASATCSGSMETGIPGVYIFERVFFHDTDTIKLTVSASGYQKFEYTQNFFSNNDLVANISLTRIP